MVTYAIAFVVTTVFSLQCTRTVRDWALRRGWVDRPDLVRKLHLKPVPAVGGLAIYISLTAGTLMAVVLGARIGDGVQIAHGSVAKILGLAAGMMLVGLWDDVWNLSANKKLALQATLAVICWTVGFRIVGGWTYGGFGFHLGILSLPATVLWILWITNAFNLIDGIDGLAAGAALFTTLALLAAAFVTNPGGGSVGAVLVILVVLAGAVSGFLRYNFNPASIFLGDSGSLLLGFLLALLSIDASQKSTAAFAIAIPLVALGLPILDTTVVVIRRLISDKPIFSGDRRHIHHVLMERGLSSRQAAILLYGVCGLLGLVSLLFLNPSGRVLGFALVILGGSLGVGLQQLKVPELRALNGHLARSIHNRRSLIAGSVVVADMVEAFDRARSLEELLKRFGKALDESGFCRVELDAPKILTPADSAISQWVRQEPAPDDGERGDDRWVWMRTAAAGPDDADGVSVFRTECPFVLGQDVDSAASGEGRRSRLVFEHPYNAAHPVSMICLLTRGAFAEFERGLTRLLREKRDELASSAGQREKSQAAWPISRAGLAKMKVAAPGLSRSDPA